MHLPPHTMPRWRMWIIGSLLLTLLVGTSLPAVAQEEEASRTPSLNQALENLAQEIKNSLAGEGVNSVSVQGFTGPPGTSAGPRIVKTLSDKLEEKLSVANSAPRGISGTYAGGMNSESGQFEIAIRAAITDRLGNERFKLTKQIFTDEQEGLAILGSTTSLPTQVTPEQQAEAKTIEEVRAETVENAVVEPTVEVAGTLVRAEPTSPYGVEILLKTPEGFQPLPPRNDGGIAFCDIPPDQIYAVRLINDSPLDAGVTLTIDGINMFEFSKVSHYRELGRVVVPAKSAGIIKGWHDIGDQAFSFQITKIADSAAARFGNVEGIGTITAVFCAAFEDAPPPDEPALATRGELATGFGPPVEQLFKEVPRKFGVARASVSIRYLKPDLADAPPPAPAPAPAQ